jgi:hypothetical protein
VRAWFSWRLTASLLDELVAGGVLGRPEPDWISGAETACLREPG